MVSVIAIYLAAVIKKPGELQYNLGQINSYQLCSPEPRQLVHRHSDVVIAVAS